MKIFLDTIGCRLNQSEIETMAQQFRAAGHEIVANAEHADLAVVNTCTVTSAAAADSRAKIRSAARKGVEEIIATGCWATIEPQKAAALSNVRAVVNNDAKQNLVWDVLDQPGEPFELEPLVREPLPGLRQRTRAFIKVQDGCDNQCTFCITAIARGNGRSRRLAEILNDIHAAVAGGTKEIVLTGVHLGSWGQDFDQSLTELIASILQETDVPRVRLSSLEPWDLTPDFFHLWENPRLCRHLHLPLQSGSDAVLRRMRRNTNRDAFRTLVAAAREVVPEVAITTDLIVGFPGETEDEFAQTLDFVREIEFAEGHIFTYSARQGTPAARMKNQVHSHLRKERNAVLRQIFSEMQANYQQRFIGFTLPVLWESASSADKNGWHLQGLTDNYLRVTAVALQPRWNQIDQVQLLQRSDKGLSGKIT